MDALINANWTVAEVLEAYPPTVTIFLSLKTNCAGCHLSRFCTLEDIVRIHALSLPELLGKLQEIAWSAQQE